MSETNGHSVTKQEMLRSSWKPTEETSRVVKDTVSMDRHKAVLKKSMGRKSALKSLQKSHMANKYVTHTVMQENASLRQLVNSLSADNFNLRSRINQFERRPSVLKRIMLAICS